MRCDIYIIRFIVHKLTIEIVFKLINERPTPFLYAYIYIYILFLYTIYKPHIIVYVVYYEYTLRESFHNSIICYTSNQHITKWFYCIQNTPCCMYKTLLYT